MSHLTPAEARARIRDVRGGAQGVPTSGWCAGYLQANLVILPRGVADAFRQFCDDNAQVCFE